MSADASQDAVDEMARDELEDEVRDLRNRVDRLEDELYEVSDSSVDVATMNHLLERLIPELEVDNYKDDPMQNLATVETFGKKLTQTVDAVEESPENPSGDPMTENWRNIVEHTRTLEDDPNHAMRDGWVALYAQDVANATDCSRRWARTLIEDLGDDHEGAKWRTARENKKEGSEDRKKALLVNLDVWGEAA